MRTIVDGSRKTLRYAVGKADSCFNRVHGWQGNPLYHSGAVAVGAFVVLLVTGVYLLLFYRVGAPYASVAAISHQAWGGRWIRTVHRYASDLAVVAIVVHAVRMFFQGRSWGPRALAWLSGLVLLFVLLVSGWTGYVMVWDVQARLFAMEGARLLDVLPIFSEPIVRAFSGETPMPGAFFFLNLFLHIALPIGLALLLWIHVARVARPRLLPPRPLLFASLGLLLLLSVVWPAPMIPEADALRVPVEVTVDLFYGFFLPITTRVQPGWTWLLGGGLAVVACLVPVVARPRSPYRPAPSVVDERLCTGCEQCYLDCPYEAISMVARQDDRPTLVARVDPGLCVSCGICAGSCAPMGVGPPGRTGRDQLAGVHAFVERHAPRDVVIVACDRGSGGVGSMASFLHAPVLPVGCAGSLHTSVVEHLIRSGAQGVLVVSCPPRDCWNREGAIWLEQRLFHDREAELQARVDRRRVRLLFAAEHERSIVAEALLRFRDDVAAIGSTAPEDDVRIEAECDLEGSVGRVPSELRT